MRYSTLLGVAAVGCFLLPCIVGDRGKEDQEWQRNQHLQRRRMQTFLGTSNSTDELLLPVDSAISNPIHSERLRKNLLKDYDLASFPWELVWEQSKAEDVNQTGIVRGLDVEVGINFHKIFEIDVTKSIADFVVWFRLQWKDPRLVWDPSEYGNVTEAFFKIDSQGNSEIWSPDIVLWNLESGLSETLIDIVAKVQYDGTIFWSRPGRLRPVCTFEGLEEFPFDTLRCTMEFGSWAYSGKYLRPTLYNDGYTKGGSETAGESYPEFTLSDISVEQNIYPPFPGSPSEDWPTLIYRVDFQRSVSPYIRGYVVLQIFLNVVGFAAFWLPVACGERMALPITAILAAVANELVVSEQLPRANVRTWMNRFSLGSTIFAFAVVLQCTVVIYFFFYTDHDLEPPWFKWMRQRLYRIDQSNRDTSTSETREPTEAKTSTSIRFDSIAGGQGDNSINYLGDSKNTQTSVVNQNSSMRLSQISNFVSFKDQTEAQDNRKWQELAARIDSASRILFPAAYVIFLAFMFATANMEGTAQTV